MFKQRIGDDGLVVRITSESSFKTIESDDGSLSTLPANFTPLKNMSETTTRKVFCNLPDL